MADIVMTATIPEDKAAIVLNAFNKASGTNLSLEFEHNILQLHGRWGFTVDSKQESENNIEFGKRFMCELVKAVVNLVDIAEDEVRYRDEISTITPPVSDVPDNIII